LGIAAATVTPDLAVVAVVDAHVHLYPPEINRATSEWAAGAGERVWAALCTRRRSDGRPVQGFPSVDELLRAMDEAAVDRAVLLGWYWQTPAACVLQNRFYAACVEAHPDRLSACVTVQPSDRKSTREELCWASEHGFVGIGELSPHSTELTHDDEAWHELLAQAAELRLPVNVHVTDPESRVYPGRVDTPLAHFVDWARRHPGTTFVLAHGGGGLPWRHADDVRDLANVYYDTAAFPLLYPPSEIERWIRELGSDRLLWGTDWPLDLYPRQTDRPAMAGFRSDVGRLALTGDARVALMGANAQCVFRLPAG